MGFAKRLQIDTDERCAQIPLVSDADSSQHSALVDALIDKRHLVVQGPPGTGKSQTITNLMAAAMGMGRSVLFVAEKKAALEVVRTRLDQCGLGDFCLELHSHRTNKGQLHRDLKRRLDGGRQGARRADRLRENLEAEKKKLIQFSESARRPLGPSGIPFHEAVWTAGRNRSLAGPEPAVLEPAVGLLGRGEIAERAVLARQCATMWRELSQECRVGWQGLFIHRAIGPEVRTVVDGIQELAKETRDLSDLLDRHHGTTGFPEIEELSTVESLGGLTETDLRPPPTLGAAEQLDPLARADQRERLRQAAEALEEAHRLRGPAAPVLESPSAQDAAAARRLAEAVRAVEQLGLRGATLAEVERRADRVAACIDAVERLMKVRDATSKLLCRRVDSLDDYRVALGLAELFTNVPRAAQNDGMTPWMRLDIIEMWERAQQRSRATQEALDQASLILRDLDAPEADHLERLAADLEEMGSIAFRPFRKKWRTVKRGLIPLLRDRRFLKDQALPEQLRQAASAIRERNAFADDTTFQAAFGDSFRGVKTPWASLEPGVMWIGKLLETVPDLFVARELVRTWADTRAQANAIAAQVSQAYRVCEDHLKEVLDEGWELSLGSLLAHLCKLRDAWDSSLPILRDAQLRPRASMEETGKATSAQARRLELIEEAQRHKELFRQLGVGWDRDETEVSAVHEGIRWVEALEERGTPETVLAWFLCGQAQPRSRDLDEIARACRHFLERRRAIFEGIRRYGHVDQETWTGSSPIRRPNLMRACEAALRTQSEASAWADWCRISNQIEDAGLKALQEVVCASAMEPDRAEALCKALCFEALVSEGLRQDPALAGFTRAAHEEAIERFRRFDEGYKDLLRQQIASRVRKRHAPRGVGSGKVGDFTELSLIQYEIGKRRRHIPIRALVRRAANALQSLKPCFLMSPMSVAQYIAPGGLEFDLVVMDEASQLKLEDSLGAVMRGKQLIVVGDSKQLPPTSFFDRIGEVDVDEDEMAAAEQAESILEVAERVFPRRTLVWHYRSKHEKLISFSNNEFYERRLIVFPSPFATHPNYGVKRHFIEGGQYSKGRNPLEARRVAEAVREHLLSRTEESLGVATFNAEQRDFVLGELERLRKDDPRFERAMRTQEEKDEPFFVKNLENVQGDEREVIFISTTYGPDPSTNRVYQRFGPINRPNGWRRLNVIFTRARKRLELFTSLHAADVVPERNRGVTAFHRYLRFAETGIIPDLGSPSGRKPDSEFEVAVSHLLTSYGYDVEAQIGVDGFFIDLAVRNPQTGTYALGIECDGATYHSAKSVRDRDRIREDILREKGWRIHRIWSADWFKNRQVEVERLIAAADSALRASEGRAATT